jgi:hypothetical protein
MANCNTIITLTDETFESCGDLGVSFKELLSTDITTVTTLKEFKDIVTSELIDVKGWKTMSSYPTLKLLYYRYMNSLDYCDTLSSEFTYSDMIRFSELVGTYWVDLIEQVIPSTTIWGSTYVYGNTIFDQQKFKYKEYTLFTCDKPKLINGDYPSPTSGSTNDVEVILTTLPNPEDNVVSTGNTTGSTITIKPTTAVETCYGVNIWQTNVGSEFVGSFTVLGGDGTDGHEINNGDIQVFQSN